MGSDPAPYFSSLFLVHKEAYWVKAEGKFRTTNVRKISNFSRFIDDLIAVFLKNTIKPRLQSFIY